MTASHVIERLDRLVRLLPLGAAPEDCLDGARILAILRDAYGDAGPEASRRALQRDLKALLAEGRIEVVNPKGKPLRFRRLAAEPDDGPGIWDYTLEQVRGLVAEALPQRRLDRLWQRLLTDPDCPPLDETRLRVVPDTLRLLPAELYECALRGVIEALARRCILQVDYRNAAGVRAAADLHPRPWCSAGRSRISSP